MGIIESWIQETRWGWKKKWLLFSILGSVRVPNLRIIVWLGLEGTLVESPLSPCSFPGWKGWESSSLRQETQWGWKEELRSRSSPSCTLVKSQNRQVAWATFRDGLVDFPFSPCPFPGWNGWKSSSLGPGSACTPTSSRGSACGTPPPGCGSNAPMRTSGGSSLTPTPPASTTTMPPRRGRCGTVPRTATSSRWPSCRR